MSISSSPLQLSCHKAILCARSPFFSNLVSRRIIAQQSERQDRGLTIPQPLKIGDRVRDAMELYQIGRFLDLDILSQNCEDALQYISGFIACKVSRIEDITNSKKLVLFFFSLDLQPGLLRKAPGSGIRVVLVVVWGW